MTASRRSGAARRAFVLLPVAAACLPAWAQAQSFFQGPSSATSGGTSQQQGLVIVPTVSVQETYSDNASLSTNNKRSDLASQGTVGLSATSRGGRLRGSVQYTLTGTTHSSNVGGDQFTNSLNALITGELITNRFFVDLTGNISQSSLSAFGTQSVDTTSRNSNRTEVSTYGISPYLRGLLTPFVAYEFRANGQWTSARASNASSSGQYGGLAHFGSTQPGVFGWTADANRTTLQYSQGGLSSTADTYRGTFLFNPNPDVQLSLIGGADRNNYLSREQKLYANEGAQARWRPSPRTNMSARFEHGYAGNSRDINLSWRSPRSAWTYVDTRGVSTSRTPTGGLVTAYTPIYLRAYEDLASAIPDPVQRDLTVRQLLARIPADATYTVSNLFLTSQVTLQSMRALTFALMGIRDTVTFRIYRSTTSGLNNQPIFNDGLTSSNAVRQSGGSIDLSHRLTAVTSASSTLQFLRNAGDRADQQTTLKAIYLNLNTRVAPRANLGGGVRHVIFDSATSPYTENAIFVNYSQSF